MRSAPLSIVLACLALAACASSPKADLRLPTAYEAPPAAPTDAVALDRWWTAFDDPQLTELVEQALAANPDARSAAARLREARATRVSLLTQFLPQGDVNGSARRTSTDQLSGTVINIPGFSTSGVSEAYSANLNVSWEIDLFGRIFAANRATRADVAAARFDYEATRASLAAEVADAYFLGRGLAIQLADARETARIDQKLYEVADKRAKAGLAASSEADRVAGELAQANAQMSALEAQLQIQRRTLLILAGRIVEPTVNINLPPEVGQAPAIPATVPGQLLARRPDVREAEARVAAAAGRADLARLSFLPTLNFTPGLGWQKQLQPGFASETSNWSVGGSAVQPLLSIPNLIAQLRVQNARTDQAVAAYESAVQSAFADAEGALVSLDSDRRRVALLTDGEARAQRAYRASLIGYSRGFNDLNATLDAEQSWRVIRTQLTAAQVQAVRRAVQAYKALGGGWPADAFPTNTQAR